MAARSQADSKRKYSWWWDSHISPKNSKWLQENLTDMDSKVKQMIKLIEEDADSFARRAEMYYKKRPELMKLVEEFYRAYRALAERYDHATGALRQAQRTMAEAFPNQAPFILGDDSPAGSATDCDPRTPDMPPIRAPFDPDELQKDALGISPSHAINRNGAFTEKSDPGRKGLKQFNDLFGLVDGMDNAKFAEGRVRKGLNFHDPEEKGRGVQNNGIHDLKARAPSESEQVSKTELEILNLKNALAKLEAEKEAGLLQYEQSLERLSKLESEVSRATENSRGLNERASKAEAEVQTLKEVLAQLEAEKESSFLQYQGCLEKISIMENNLSLVQKDAGELNERASKAETEARSLKQDMCGLEAEKIDAQVQYSQCLEKISDLEDKLHNAQEDAKRFSERADDAEREIEALKHALTKLTEEKEAAFTQYQQCLVTIVSLEHKIACFEEEARRLNLVIDDGTVKLRSSEERCLLLEKSNQTIHSELESVMQKVAAQSDELTEKQKELGRLWACVQEEHLRFMEAETAFQTLQHLHSQSQEELRSVVAQLQNRAQILEDLEARNQSLKDEVEHVRVENKSLSEVNFSSALTIQNLQDEISSLRETIKKLEAEVELRVDQRNALQQEIYCLKEELNELNQKHQAIMRQVESAGFSPESFGSSVKDLKDVNIMLKEVCERDRTEKVSLLEKLENMEKLNDKNALLENSLSDLNQKHQAIMRQVESVGFSPESFGSSVKDLKDVNIMLKEVCERDRTEKVSLLEKLENMEKLIDKNALLENSLSDLNQKHQAIMRQVESVGFSPESFGSSVKDLKDVNIMLKEVCERDRTEKVSLLEKLENMEKLIDKNALLENSLSDLNQKHQAIMRQVESAGFSPESFGSSVKDLKDVNIMLKEVCERDRTEKVSLLEKLENMEKLIDKNALLENSLSDLNVELEGVGEKLKALEESCQYLVEEKSILVSEKDLMASELQFATDNLEKLTEKNHILENFLLDANAELEGLREKSKSLEDFCLLLVNEKSELASMKGSLSSQLDISEKSLQDLEKNYTELEEKYSLLEKDRQSSLHEVQELQVRLDAEKQEHANLAQLSESQLAGMASQICLLQEESLCRKKEYEKELDKAVNAEIEIFILQKCAQELEENNSSLLLDHQKLMEASKLSEKLISDMRHENCEQQEEVECLSDKIKTLRMGLYQVLMTLELDANQCENKSKQDQKLLNHVLNRLQESQEFLFKTQDENQRLFTENSVLVTLLGQLQLEVENLVKTQDEELTTRSEQFLVLQNESQELSGINEEMKLKLMEGDRKEEALKVELNNLHVQLSDLQGAFQNLQEENCKVLDDQRSLMKSFSDLQMEKCELEEENFCILVETVSQSTLSLIFRDIICEKSVEIKSLGESLDKLCHDNIGLNEKVKTLEKELDKFSGLEDEKRELHKMVEDLKCKYDEVEVIRSDQEMQIIKLSGDYDQKTKEAENIREVNQKLEFEIRKLHEEFQEVKDRKENLSHELVKERNEVELQESQAVALFAELQISAVREALFEGKLLELLQICESLEDGNCSKDMEIDQLKERVSTLEGGNAELKALVAAYLPAFMSLRDCVTSLEKHALPDATLHEGDSKESKDAAVVVHAKGFHQMSEGQSGMVPGGTLDFQDLQMRIRAIEKEIIEKERLVMLENLSYHSKLDAAIRQIEELKSGSSARQKGVETRRYVKPKPEDGELGATPSDDLRRQKRTHEISEDGNEVMTKDIILDQISDCSSHGISRRETKQADEHMLEIWETADRDDSIDLTVGKTQKVTASQKKKKHIRQRPSAESTVEKEVGVDKLEISKRLSGSRQEGNERKILERLDSDAQKLTNLQITVQDLMSKVEITEKSEQGKGIEYDNVKEQLEESEEAIIKLFEVNRKLMKTVEDEPQYFEEKPELAPDESGSVRRRKISEQARRVSEKIGRLQLEVQKLQFVLLKLDDENRSRGKTKITEGKTKVLLQDYLYGSTRTRQKRKKAHFCSCVQPPTKGD